MTTADLPALALAPARPPTPAAMVRAARRSPGGRVRYHGVSWARYAAARELVGDGWPRLTYDDGELELRMPGREHEQMRWTAGRFVEAHMDAAGIDYEPVGSMTLGQESQRGAVEPDESYYIQSKPLVTPGEIDLAVDPPPDLAIEIDLSPPAMEKASIYARLGVPEIWRWRRGRLFVTERRPDPAGGHHYGERERSIALPDFPLDRLAAELARSPHLARPQSVREFRRWCEQQAARQ